MAGTDPVLDEKQKKRHPSNIELAAGISDPLIGLTVAEYTIQSVLGNGGMGVVYLAEQKEIGRKAAVKVLRPEIASDKEWSERFRNEAQILARLKDINVVDILNYGRVPDGRSYLMMDYLEGEELQQYLEENAPLSAAQTLNITAQMLNGLTVAHKAGIVHRDIKAENVFLMRSHSGELLVKLVDFGLAPLNPVKLSVPGEAQGPVSNLASLRAGTPSYVAPEQARGERPDVRSDLYSVGVTVFYMLTGRLPFEAEGVVELLRQHAFQPPPKVSSLVSNVPHELETLVDDLLMKDPAQRPPTAEAVRQRVVRMQRSLAQESTAVRGVAMPEPKVRGAPVSSKHAPTAVVKGKAPSEPARRSGLKVVAAVLAVVLVAGGGAAVWWRTRPAPAPVVPQIENELPSLVQRPVVRSPDAECPDERWVTQQNRKLIELEGISGRLSRAESEARRDQVRAVQIQIQSLYGDRAGCVAAMRSLDEVFAKYGDPEPP